LDRGSIGPGRDIVSSPASDGPADIQKFALRGRRWFRKREELEQEGNAFEAIPAKARSAKRSGVSRATTREVPEDYVPAEYLDTGENVA